MINPLNTKVLTFNNYVGYIYRFIDLPHFREVNIPKKLFEFGRIVGEFNKISIKILSVDLSNKWIEETLKESKKTILDLKNKKHLKKVINLMKLGVLKVEGEYNGSKYRTILSHRDLHFDNVLYDKYNKKYIIIDVNGLQEEILAQEIMVIISYLISNNYSRNKRIINEIMSGYSSKINLTRKEKKIIPLLIIIRKLGECMWLLSQHHNKKINKKEFKLYLKDSIEQLEIGIKQFESLKQIFKKV